ncbi:MULTISPECIES: energy-coupling factor transporter transmembrane component T family protein [Geobacillus thermoleovorans group]|uniref:Energy-coupling factor transporter transmembrane protein EcfT n=1 Tax=Geobacillus thermoleovorans CCB_US3_UF5 TaxID=1111068 RepID=A0ABM5MCV8_GEOTH|nr:MULTISPECIES: energy-coupling factor transporter transmembrane protein EcfT [Geobacillus thermoleovorans group]AEV17481.1 permease ybaF [Geobacillus thermoleovorans CCB_US3_UF5]KPC97855.1 Energy-coupling factor transporter transmembrane protein EcfT [Geobacillus sp. BCO2]QDY71888.1 energy-coupling factor transporter transmembrane protein EcfT [Geobacillus thermoleovorans]GAJ56875.1 cobalt transporter system permease [Geobacillus thermoleovorans B23]
MTNHLIIGQYVPGHSVIHRLDPRAKLLIVFAYVLIVFLANNAVTYALLSLFAFAFAALSRIPFSFIARGLKPILWVVLFTLLLHLFMTKEGDVICQIGPLSVYEGGIKQGAFISLRFLLLVWMTTMLTLTTTPIEVTDGVESLLGPLKKMRVPVHELALMMAISLRFIPTLMEETEKIMKAQAARGVDFSGGRFSERMKAIVSLLVPLFISSFKRADELATAMEARGYRGGEGRTKFRQLAWKPVDTVFLAAVALLFALLCLLRS